MIHQYKLGGFNIVLDVCSGAVHVVDEVAYDIIGLFEEKSREDILAAMAEKYWQPPIPIRSIRGGRFTILGTGDIGRHVARRLRAMGADPERDIRLTVAPRSVTGPTYCMERGADIQVKEAGVC